MVSQTGEELLAMAKAGVDRRIAEYQEAIRTHPNRAEWASPAGSLVYGGAEDPYEQQVTSRVECFRGGATVSARGAGFVREAAEWATVIKVWIIESVDY